MTSSKNDRKTCPRCHHTVPMSFMFPSPQPEPAVEAEVGRFQDCSVCGWSGDAYTGEAFAWGRDGGVLVVNDRRFNSIGAFVKWWVARAGVEGRKNE